MDRDTQKCAFKVRKENPYYICKRFIEFSFQCCYAVMSDGQEVEVYKDPVTDPGKLSKKGKLVLVKEDGEFNTIKESEKKPGQDNELVTVYLDGEMVKEWSFAEVRRRAELRREKE